MKSLIQSRRCIMFAVVAFAILASLIVVGCSSGYTPSASTPASTWSPDSSKVISYPRADLEKGIEVAITPGDHRIIPIEVEEDEKLLCFMWSVIEDSTSVRLYVKDSAGSTLEEVGESSAGCGSFSNTQGMYYLYLDNQYSTKSIEITFGCIWELIPSLLEATPATLPVSGSVELAPYGEFGICRNPKYSAVTCGCMHYGPGISLTTGQKVKIELESDWPIYSYENEGELEDMLMVMFRQMDNYFEDCGWTASRAGADIDYALSFDGGRRQEIVLTITDVRMSDTYKLTAINYDPDDSHWLEYTISH